MKKIFVILAILFLIPLYAIASEIVIPTFATADIVPTIGVYQAPSEITLYKEPSETSDIVHNIKWLKSSIFPESVKFDELFLVHIPSKNLAFLTVTDETEDWVEVIYNDKTGDKGWIKKDDPYRFMTWTMFYNVYGRKYGLSMLKDIPEEAKEIQVGTDNLSQVVSTINVPQKINLTAIKGNWALVSVFDVDKMPKTGFIRWRSDNGTRYYFPAIK